MDSYWKRKTFVIITGASRGIGRAAAEKIADLVSPDSVILLVSRDEDQLTAVKTSIQKHSKVNIQIGAVDLSACNEKTLSLLLSSTLADLNMSWESFDHAICIHNAGSLGDLTKRAIDLNQTGECDEYFRLNLISVLILNGLFVKNFTKTEKTVVNISSLCAVQPFPSFSLYCTGKAARDMFFKVLAAEEPEIRVLNYSPGPVATEMQTQILEQSWNSTLTESARTGRALTPQETINRLMYILGMNTFESGAHIDYFDIVD